MGGPCFVDGAYHFALSAYSCMIAQLIARRYAYYAIGLIERMILVEGSAIDKRFLPPQVQLSNSVREIWVDMIRLIRVYITRTLFNVGVQESKDAVDLRLKKTAAQLRELLIPYYGEDVGNQVQVNFLDFIYQLERLIDAYGNNDQDAIAQHRMNLQYLANNFSQSYAIINSYYNRAVVQQLFYEFINSVENQVISIIYNDYSADLKEYDRFMNVAYRLADEFIYGILRQSFYSPGG